MIIEGTTLLINNLFKTMYKMHMNKVFLYKLYKQYKKDIRVYTCVHAEHRKDHVMSTSHKSYIFHGLGQTKLICCCSDSPVVFLVKQKKRKMGVKG